MKEGQTPGPWGRVVWVTGWGPAPSTLLSSSPRSQDLGRRQRGADWRRGGEQGQQQKNLICTVRPFESLLLQYTLTKIESHFISIQQQQKNSFLDCYTANGFQRLLFTVTVAKREGALGLGAGTGGSETMRAHEQGGEVAAKELGGWERAQEETREAGLRTSRPPPTLTPSHVHSSGTCTCRGGPVPSLTPPTEPPHSSSCPQSPPACGQLYRAGVTEGKGAIALS